MSGASDSSFFAIAERHRERDLLSKYFFDFFLFVEPGRLKGGGLVFLFHELTAQTAQRSRSVRGTTDEVGGVLLLQRGATTPKVGG